MSANAERSLAVEEAMADIRAIDAEGINRDAVELIRRRLLVLAQLSDLFPWSEFPPDESRDGNALYLLSQDDDHRFALYVREGQNRSPTTRSFDMGLHSGFGGRRNQPQV